MIRFACPRHKLFDARTAENCVLEGHDGSLFGSYPDDDGYTGVFYCGIRVGNDYCGRKLIEVDVDQETHE